MPHYHVWNFIRSLAVFIKEMPDAILCTGGGVALPMCLIGRAAGRRVILVETFSRRTKPSMMGRIVSKFANVTIIQWKELKHYLPNAIYGGPIFNINVKPSENEGSGIFVTVGNHPDPFDRLLKKLDELVENGSIKEKVFAQTSSSHYKPRHYEWKEDLPFEDFQRRIRDARLVICHAGVGSVLNALEYGKTCIAVTRLQKYHEHTDDHQLDIAEGFGEMGLIIPVVEMDELEGAIEKARTFKPAEIKLSGNIQEIINGFLNNGTLTEEKYVER